MVHVLVCYHGALGNIGSVYPVFEKALMQDDEWWGNFTPPLSNLVHGRPISVHEARRMTHVA